MQEINNLVQTFGPHQPSDYAKPGDVLIFNTIDCFGGAIKTEQDWPGGAASGTTDDEDMATGLVYVEGAEVGDVLVVDILDLVPAPYGITCALGGPLAAKVEQRTKFTPVVNNVATFNDISFLVEPMIGVIGVAPADGEFIPCVLPGSHGGNMDCKKIKKGSRLYFPVRQPGALLGMGDVHSSQGDGELCGTGIESNARITVRVDVIKNFELNWPVVETPDKWYVNTNAPEYKQALDAGCEELARLMAPAYGWDITDIFLYMSLRCDIEINQFTLPCPIDMTLRVGIPKVPGKDLIKR